MYYLVNGYRFITQKKLKIHEIDTDKICVLKNQFQETIKTYPTFFQQMSSQHVLSRPYPNVKIILAYFYIMKTI